MKRWLLCKIILKIAVTIYIVGAQLCARLRKVLKLHIVHTMHNVESFKLFKDSYILFVYNNSTLVCLIVAPLRLFIFQKKSGHHDLIKHPATIKIAYGGHLI